MDSTQEIDSTDRRILRALQRAGRQSFVDLAAEIGLTESPCLRRVKRLEETGVISGYAAELSQRSLGLDDAITSPLFFLVLEGAF